MIAPLLMVSVFCVIGRSWTCDQKGISNCLLGLPGAATSQAFLPSMMIKECNYYPTLKRCLSKHTDGCSDGALRSVHMATSFLDYYCVPRIIRVLKRADQTCMGEDKLSVYERMLSKCDTMQLAQSCSKSKSVTACVTKFMKKACDSETGAVYHNLFSHLIATTFKVGNGPVCDIPPMALPTDAPEEPRPVGESATEVSRVPKVGLLDFETPNRLHYVVSNKNTHDYHHKTGFSIVTKPTTAPRMPGSSVRTIAEAPRVPERVVHDFGASGTPQNVASHENSRDYERVVDSAAADAYRVGYIVGYVFGAFLLAGVVIGAIVFLMRRHHRISRDALVYHDSLATI